MTKRVAACRTRRRLGAAAVEAAIILPLVQILGQRGEVRAALPSQGGQQRGLVRALFYADRRVQFADHRHATTGGQTAQATVKGW